MGRELGVSEEDHEVRKLALVGSQLSDHEHEMHPECIAPESEEKALPQAKEPGVSPEHVEAHRQHREAEVLSPDPELKARDMKSLPFLQQAVQTGQENHHTDQQEEDDLLRPALKGPQRLLWQLNHRGSGNARGIDLPVLTGGKG